MNLPQWPTAQPLLPGSAWLRAIPEDFRVDEELGFEPSGSGEHVFLHLEKRLLTTEELVARLSRFTGVAARNIGYCGLKDRNAVTRQWVSIALAPAAEPEWAGLETEGDVRVLQVARHARKLKRGVHRANRFSIRLRQLQVDQPAMETALERVRMQGAPNYFGPQRFGRGGSSLAQARRAVADGQKLSRHQRHRYYSALRAFLFNELLAQRVRAGTWNRPESGDVCALHGTRSVFVCEQVDAQLLARVHEGDVHPALPLWGTGGLRPAPARWLAMESSLAEYAALADYLESAGLSLSWRPSRLMPDDFCWEFCDDDSLQLNFLLGAGQFATALLAELVYCTDDRCKGQQSTGQKKQ